MLQSDTPLQNNDTDSTISADVPKETGKPSSKKPFFYKRFIEGMIVFTLLVFGFFLEIVYRDIFTENMSLNFKLIQLVLQRSFLVTLVFILSYRVFKSSILLATTFLSFKYTNTTHSKSFDLLNDVFLILASIIVSMPVRPILQESEITIESIYLSQAYVRFDAIPSAIILFIPAIPLLFLTNKYKTGFEKIFRIISILTVIIIVSVVNNQSNYTARIYESRANWVGQNWEKQKTDAQNALQDAKNDDEKATAYFWLGVAANRNKDYEKAILYQLQAIQLKPEYAAAHASLANGYLFTNQLEKSFHHAKLCVEYDPKYAWCYFSLANYYATRGEIDTAIHNAEIATKLDPYDKDLQKQLQSLIEYKKN